MRRLISKDTELGTRPRDRFGFPSPEPRTPLHRALLLVASILLAAQSRVQAQWPQFRGPDGLGTSDSKTLPLAWSEEKNVRWKTADTRTRLVVARHSRQPGVAHDGDGGRQGALRRGRGSEHRQDHPRHQSFSTSRRRRSIAPFNTYASPTPVVEKGRVYVTFGSTGTAAIEPPPARCCGNAAIWSAITSAAPVRRRSSSATC